MQNTQLDAGHAGQGARMCTGETIQKEGLSGQLDKVTQTTK